jgi:hypothetical protein
MNAFIRKEFRESVRWLPLGWLLMAGLLWAGLPGLHQIEKVPDLSETLYFWTAVGSAFIAIGLSIAQFAPDQRTSARAFLLQRGLCPTQIFQGKLLVGVAMYSAAIGLPLLIGAAYLETTGPLRLPTSARQTIPAWFGAIYSFAFYFGGCLIVCSTARWIGTRVLPVASAFLVALASLAVLRPSPLWFTSMVVALGALGMLVLFRASRDAFVNGSKRVAPFHGSASNAYKSFVLICAALVTTAGILSFITNLSESGGSEGLITESIDDLGDPWFVSRDQDFGIRRRAKITSGEHSVIEDVPKWFKATLKTAEDSVMLVRRLPTSDASLIWSIKRIALSWVGVDWGVAYGAGEKIYDTAGHLLIYKPMQSSGRNRNHTWLLNHVIGQDRVSRVGEPRGRPFANCPVAVGISTRSIILSTEGVFLCDVESGRVEKVFANKVVGYAVRFTKNGHHLYLFCEEQILSYRVLTSNESTPQGNATEPVAFSLELEATINVGKPLAGDSQIKFWYESEENFTAVSWIGQWEYQVIKKRPGKDIELFRTSVPKPMLAELGGPSIFDSFKFGFIVPALGFAMAFLGTLIASYSTGIGYPGFVEGMEWMFVALTIQVILSCVVAYIASRHRGLSKKACVGWAIAGALLGFGIGLAILAIYARCFRESCTGCQKPRRLELPLCEHCGNGWDLPDDEGVEIIEQKTTLQPVALSPV